MFLKYFFRLSLKFSLSVTIVLVVSLCLYSAYRSRKLMTQVSHVISFVTDTLPVGVDCNTTNVMQLSR